LVFRGPTRSIDSGVQPVSGGFQNSYEIAYGNLVVIPDQTTVSNYNVNKGGATGSLFADGTFINRHFKANEYDGISRTAGECGRT